MGLFKRKDKIVDLTGHYKKQQEKINALKESMNSNPTTPSNESNFGFLGSIAGASSNSSQDSFSNKSESSGYIDIAEPVEEKRKKLAKRLLDMTNKLEDLSNQIYHLQQRIEVLERKNNIRDY